MDAPHDPTRSGARAEERAPEPEPSQPPPEPPPPEGVDAEAPAPDPAPSRPPTDPPPPEDLEAEEADAEAPAERPRPPRPPVINLRGKKFLVVEDTRTTRALLVETLSSFGAFVEEARDGLEALSILKDGAARGYPVDLVFLDLMMPRLDGFSTLRQMRRDPQLRATPVLIVSAKGYRDDLVHAARYGISGYVLKPFRINHLVNTVLRFLEQQGRGALLCPDALSSPGQPLEPEEARIEEEGARGLSLEEVRALRALLVEAVTGEEAGEVRALKVVVEAVKYIDERSPQAREAPLTPRRTAAPGDP